MDEPSRLSDILGAIGHHQRSLASLRQFGPDDAFAVQVASAIGTRLRAWAMVYRTYVAKEFAEPSSDSLWYGLHDAVPGTTTFLVTHRDRDVATMSVAFDSPVGLPAESLYRDEVDRLRRAGRRPCEYISLASEGVSTRAGTDALKQMFRLAHVMATRIEDATDTIITVNPRHRAFYERTMLFRQIGEQRNYQKVGGAPAVLMCLPLDTSEVRYREAYGTEADSLYRFFFGSEQVDDLLPFLRDGRGPLAEEDVTEYFVRRRQLIASASIRAHRYLQACYPSLGRSLPLHLVSA